MQPPDSCVDVVHTSSGTIVARLSETPLNDALPALSKLQEEARMSHVVAATPNCASTKAVLGRRHTPTWDVRVSREHIQLLYVDISTVLLLVLGRNPVDILLPSGERIVLSKNQAPATLSIDCSFRILRSHEVAGVPPLPSPFDFSFKKSQLEMNPPGKRVSDERDLGPLRRVRPRIAACSSANKPTLRWVEVERDSFWALVAESNGTSSEFVVGLDVDFTIIKPLHGHKFPSNAFDWEWWSSQVLPKLAQFTERGARLVMVSNQAGIQAGKMTLPDVQARLGAVCDGLMAHGVSVAAVLVSIAKDHHRKPNSLMFDWWVEHLNGNIAPTTESGSIFVGDAAGRKRRAGKPADFSCGDRAFAMNIGLRFFTPEQVFLGEAVAGPWEWHGSCDPFQFLPTVGEKLIAIAPPICSRGSAVELVLTVGPPASGKSTLARRSFPTYVRVNQDEMKTRSRCLNAVQAALVSNHSVIVDNTNPSLEVRKEYLEIARRHGVPVGAIYLRTPIELCRHLNLLRERTSCGSTPRLPPEAFTNFFKWHCVPTTDEGFETIVLLDWTPVFDTQDDRNAFCARTVE